MTTTRRLAGGYTEQERTWTVRSFSYVGLLDS